MIFADVTPCLITIIALWHARHSSGLVLYHKRQSVEPHLSSDQAARNLSLPGIFGDYEILASHFERKHMYHQRTLSFYINVIATIASVGKPDDPYLETAPWTTSGLTLDIHSVKAEFTNRAAMAAMWYAGHLIAIERKRQGCTIGVHFRGNLIGGLTIESNAQNPTAIDGALDDGQTQLVNNTIVVAQTACGSAKDSEHTAANASSLLQAADDLYDMSRLDVNHFRVLLKYHNCKKIPPATLLFTLISSIAQAGLHQLDEVTETVFLDEPEAGYGIIFEKAPGNEKVPLNFEYIILALRQAAGHIAQHGIWVEWDGLLVLNDKIIGSMVMSKAGSTQQQQKDRSASKTASGSIFSA